MLYQYGGCCHGGGCLFDAIGENLLCFFNIKGYQKTVNDKTKSIFDHECRDALIKKLNDIQRTAIDFLRNNKTYSVLSTKTDLKLFEEAIEIVQQVSVNLPATKINAAILFTKDYPPPLIVDGNEWYIPEDTICVLFAIEIRDVVYLATIDNPEDIYNLHKEACDKNLPFDTWFKCNVSKV